MASGFQRSIRSELQTFWWECGKAAMEDLANLGPPPPITGGLSEKDELLALYNFDRHGHRPTPDLMKRFRASWERKLLIYETDEELLTIRDELRNIFENGKAVAAQIMSGWNTPRRRLGKIKLLFIDIHGTQLPLPHIELRHVLVMVILGVLPKMTKCANPDCPSPYFLRHKKTQRFCDRPACLAYGQRIHKLNWWREHGEQKRVARRKELRNKQATRKITQKRTGGKH